VAEDVYIKFGHYQIDAARMQDYVRQQEINKAEIERIVKARWMHLDWMHRHFAYEVLEPPEGVE
jgi:hypothetical protein